ncbi:MAG: hypothetical protein IKH16_13370 [Selenomonadaceae bacterium]|nr:hypothetical protein [Selenomonadaceae bacterium]
MTTNIAGQTPRTLKECFPHIPPELEPYVNDYKIHVFEIAWLPDETIKKFKSDFRFVADYYSQMRKNQRWEPMPGKVKHVKELFDLFGSLTSDKRFIEMYHHRKGEQNDMASIALDYLEAELAVKIGNRMRNEGRNEGINEGRDLERLDSIRNLMKSSNWTAQQAMDALLVPNEDRQRYVSRI